MQGDRYGMLTGRCDTFELSMAAPLATKLIPKSVKDFKISFPLTTGSPGNSTYLSL